MSDVEWRIRRRRHVAGELNPLNLDSSGPLIDQLSSWLHHAISETLLAPNTLRKESGSYFLDLRVLNHTFTILTRRPDRKNFYNEAQRVTLRCANEKGKLNEDLAFRAGLFDLYLVYHLVDEALVDMALFDLSVGRTMMNYLDRSTNNVKFSDVHYREYSVVHMPAGFVLSNTPAWRFAFEAPLCIHLTEEEERALETDARCRT